MLTIDELFQAPKDCSIPCDIIDIQRGDLHSCDNESDTYLQDFWIYYEGTNLTGRIMLEIDGNSEFYSFSITHQSPQRISVPMPTDGQLHDIFVKFSDESSCTIQKFDFVQAIWDCKCKITALNILEEPQLQNDGTYDICFL